jgi:hypothetical protein
MRDLHIVQLTGDTPDSYNDRQSIDHIWGCGTGKQRALQSSWLSPWAIGGVGELSRSGNCGRQPISNPWRGLRVRSLLYGVLRAMICGWLTYVNAMWFPRLSRSHENILITRSLTYSARTWQKYCVPIPCQETPLRVYRSRVTYFARTGDWVLCARST